MNHALPGDVAEGDSSESPRCPVGTARRVVSHAMPLERRACRVDSETVVTDEAHQVPGCHKPHFADATALMYHVL